MRGYLGVYGQNSLSNQKFEIIKEVILYTNPAKNILNVDLANYYKEVTYTVYNSTGKVILDNINLKDNIINVDFLDSGLNFLKVESENHIKYFNFIKQ